MPDKRFEDKVTIEEILANNKQKELLAKIYLQTLKTNGTVKKNCEDIEKLEVEMRGKIGWKLFASLVGILTALIVLFNVLNTVAGG